MREPSSRVWVGSRFASLVLLLVIATNAGAQTSFYDFDNPPLAPVGGLTEANGTLYGTNGGGRDGGSLFHLDPTGPYAWEQTLSGLDWGWDPHGGLMLSNGFLYGTTRYGGQWGKGTIFKVDLANSYPYAQTIASFHNEGEGPYGGLVAIGSYFYGVTRDGGTNGLGTIYRFDPATQAITMLHSFAGPDGVNPEGSLVAAGLVLYGATPAGGASNLGTVFRLNLSTSPATFTSLASFDNSTLPGSTPNGDLVANGTTLFGTTQGGGTGSAGTIFKVNISTAAVTNVLSLTGSDGLMPMAGLLLSGGMLYGTAREGGIYNSGTLFELSPSSTTFSRVTPFREWSPVWVRGPDSRLIAFGPYLYGMASAGWTGGGQLYQFDPAAGVIEDIYDNYLSDGFTPTGHVAIIGNYMYGTTDAGPWAGSVFRIDMTEPNSYYAATFEPFSYADGYDPDGLRLIGSDLYGVTRSGGDFNCGTVYKVNPTTLAITVVASLSSAVACEPQGTLTQRGSYLYGTARYGGAFNSGSVFKVNATTGAVSLAASFDGTMGIEPSGSLASSGTDLFGVLSGYSWTTGSVFRVDASDNLTLTAFINCNSLLADGSMPIGDLVATGGYLYGTAYDDCFANGGGTIFRVNPSNGEVITQFAFDAPNAWSTTTPGARPMGGLTLHDGFLYGSTTAGGRNGGGTFFRFNPSTQEVTTLWSFRDWSMYPPIGWDARSPLTSSGGYLYGVASQGGRLAGGTAFTSNASPGFTTAAISCTAGSPASVRTLGTVFDLEEPAGSLTVALPYTATGLTNGPPTNTAGTVTASLAAQCDATVGMHYLTVHVTDSAFGRSDNSAQVTVVANPAPAIGTYGDLSINAGQSVNVTPSSGPTDNGTVSLAVVKPAGYTGTATVNAAGVVSIGSPNAGVHTFTVNVTDNCTAVTSRTFTLTANEPFGAPPAFTATAGSASSVALSWSPVASATRYDVFRNNTLLASTTTPGYVDNTVAANTSYFYKVRAAANSILSPFSLPDAATTVVFENDPLASGMIIAASHLTQLRTAVNALRGAAGLTPATFTDNPLSPSDAVAADHVTQLRNALNGAREAVGLGPLAFTDSLVAGTTRVKAVHFHELRNGVK